MAEILRTNQIQMELLAEMTKTLGKVADLLVPEGAPEAQLGRYSEPWLVEKEVED